MQLTLPMGFELKIPLKSHSIQNSVEESFTSVALKRKLKEDRNLEKTEIVQATLSRINTPKKEIAAVPTCKHFSWSQKITDVKCNDDMVEKHRLHLISTKCCRNKFVRKCWLSTFFSTPPHAERK